MSCNTDVLIVNPGALEKIYQGLSKNLAAIEPPIWAALLANGLRAKHISANIVDCEAENLGANELCSRVADYDPKLLVVVVYGQQPSASTQCMHGAQNACKALKEKFPDKKILLIGGHVSALPEQSLKENQADFVCRGEGLYTIEGLLNINLENSKDYSKVPGLLYWEKDKIIHNKSAPLIQQSELATVLPGMAWDLLPMEKYRAHNWHCFDHINDRQPYASLYTSLGCPFKCTFCCINAPFGGSSFRYWDPEFMITEFDTLANKYNVKNVKIADEMFVLNPNHYSKLCDLLIERDHGFNIWAYARIDTVKPKFLEKLKKAGVNWIVLGIESMSSYVRDGVDKGRFTDTDIHNVVKMIKEHGIHVHGNYICGLPDDDFKSLNENLDLAIELNCEMSNFYSGMAYPGSELYNIALQNNWKLPEDWIGFSQHAYETLPLPTKHLSAGEVLAFRDHAWSKYHTNPKYLKLLREKFGQSTHDHVLEMTKYEMQRKHTTDISQHIQ